MCSKQVKKKGSDSFFFQLRQRYCVMFSFFFCFFLFGHLASKASSMVVKSTTRITSLKKNSIPRERRTAYVGDATRLRITGSATQIAGTEQQITITALDASDHVDLNYTGERNLTFTGASQVYEVDSTELVLIGGSAQVVADLHPQISGYNFESEVYVTFLNGIATVPMVLYKAEMAEISVLDSEFSIQSNLSDQLSVQVLHAPIAKLKLRVNQLNYNRIPIFGRNELSVVDDYYNPIIEFDASLTPIQIQLANLPGTFLRSNDSNILNQSTDFIHGVADLSRLGFTYKGRVTAIGGFVSTLISNPDISLSKPIVFYGGDAIKFQIRLGSSASVSRNAGLISNFTINSFDQDGNNAVYYRGIKSIVFSADAHHSNTGLVPKIGNKDIGEEVNVNFNNGSSNVISSVFYLVEEFYIAASDGVVNSPELSDQLKMKILVANTSKFKVALNSPQTSEIPFVGTNTLTALDAYDNIVTGYNAASSGNAVTVSTTLAGSISGLSNVHILNKSTDFVSGRANLTDLGFTYIGNEGVGSFTFRKATGNIFVVSTPVTILSGDRDKDGLSDTYEQGGDSNNLIPIDTDQDGTPDYLDVDSDNDGILDSVEGKSDLDVDLIPSYRDTDSDNDEVLDVQEGNSDQDQDNLPRYLDEDSDNDGISDRMELDNDTDGDGIPNSLDVDSDNDGIPDLMETNRDSDGDRIADYEDLDSDNDGILDGIEGHDDQDHDGIPNFLDADSDNDGILDAWEAVDITRGTIDQNYDGQVDVAGTFSDSNGNGLGDMLEIGFGGKPANIPDTDRDGIPDFLDLDSDGDSLLDQQELTADPDSDGIPNYRDLDADGDWLGDRDEGDEDNDLDGKANYLDTDSDNDGIPDAWEGKNKCAACQTLQDEKGDGWDDRGQYVVVIDTDRDGQADYLDADSDNDTLPDRVELGADFDGDELPNFRDVDSDNDRIPDTMEAGNKEKPRDSDEDGLADFEDADADNDGLPDVLEVGLDPLHPDDFDIDGIPNYLDQDADGDGILDTWELGKNPLIPVDTDADGHPDYLDQDADGDGITDAIEKGKSSDPQDTDQDGSPDFQDTDTDGDSIPDKLEAGTNALNPMDTDADGQADFLDLDSDNDSIVDQIEVGPNPLQPVDTDQDGIADFREIDSDADRIPDQIELGADLKNPIDTDGDLKPDYQDIDSDNDGIPDTLEVGSKSEKPLDTDLDGRADYMDTDSDGDGINDYLEAGPYSLQPLDTDADKIPNFQDLDSDADGISDALEAGINPSILADYDKDGIPNYMDLDSDNDTIPDKAEAKPFIAGLPDTDLDGQADYVDVDTDNDKILDRLEVGKDVNNPVDTDQDGLADFRDLDADGDRILDTLELGKNPLIPVDTDGDGMPDFVDIDSDNNGIQDTEEVGPDPSHPLDTDADGIYNFLDPDDDGDGLADKLENDLNFGALPDCDYDGIPNQMDADRCDTYLTNGFSPNGDGVNDLFAIPGIMSLLNHHLSIFNRWGNLVYETDNYKNDWDGKVIESNPLFVEDGRLVDGIYFYVIDFHGLIPNISSFLFVNRLIKN
ncbi:gliding motility-associated C-terminal domain-containing protein [Aquirufa beregesia]